MTLLDRDIAFAPAPHRWSVDDYLRASEAGIFESQRVQLIEGELIDMPGQKDPHAWAISRLVRIFGEIYPDPYWIKIQATLRLNEFSGPEPDVAVLSGPPSPPAVETPIPLLIVEVSETTLHYDRGVKASLYAAHGIADYWVADVITKQVEVLRVPARDASKRFGWGYSKSTIFHIGERIIPLSASHAGMDVAGFLG